MPLNNTIILSEDINQALAEFDNALQHDKVTLIIFGDTPKSNQAVTSADGLANGSHAGFARQVIWMKDTGQWNSLKGSLSNGTITVNSVQPDQTIALSITLSNKTEFVTDISKTPDNIVMTLAFIKASKA